MTCDRFAYGADGIEDRDGIRFLFDRRAGPLAFSANRERLSECCASLHRRLGASTMMAPGLNGLRAILAGPGRPGGNQREVS